MTVTRGNTNGNVRGSNATRRARRKFIVEHYPADVDMVVVLYDDGTVKVGASPFTPDPGCQAWVDCHVGWAAYDRQAVIGAARGGVSTVDIWVVPAVRCSRCGVLCHDQITYQGVVIAEATFTCDRIFPGKHGGQYGTPTRDRKEKRTNVRPYCGPCNSQTGGALASRGKR